MSYSKSLIVLLVTWYVVYCSSAPSMNKTWSKTWVKHYKFPNKLVFTDSSCNGTHLMYSLCSTSIHERNCKITLENLDNTNKALSCNVTLKISPNDTDVHDYVRVERLNNDRVLVLSMEDKKLRLININIRSCSAKDTVLALDEKHHMFSVSIVAYENSYDIFFANSELCQNRSCRVTFDNDLKVVKDAVAWGEEYNSKFKYIGDLKSVAHRSPVSGFIGKTILDGGEPLVFFINNDEQRILNLTTGNDETDIAITSMGNNIGTCLNNWIGTIETLECKQFDYEGKLVKTELQVNTSSLIGEEKRIHYIEKHYLTEEGFVVLAVLCPKSQYVICSGDESYAVYRFNGNGEKLKAIEITDFMCERDLIVNHPRIFQNDAGQICISLPCQVNFASIVEKLSIGVRCFTVDEL